ncbi:hypothetical protein ACFCX4_05410 [Kitasatospora sp. NPDC056327]|uniref:hypothetical protein n=1 Tax=Kitasatospora sp. NPDC056327 TaxID=3345785 RepID=UPI0035DC4ABD
MALFLRKRVDESALTMTEVAARLPFSKSRVGAFLPGDPVPERAFVVALVRVTVPEPVLRQRHEADACRLWEGAEHPQNRDGRDGGGDLAGELESVRARQVDTYEQLTRSLEQRAELQQAAQSSIQLVMLLLTMINDLEGRVQALSAERDRLLGRVGDRSELEETQARLARALDQERRAKEELDRARGKQRQTDELARRIEAQVRELTDELDRLRADGPDPEPPVVAAGAAQTAPGAASLVTDPAADVVDRALARAAAVNDADDETLRRITDALGDSVRSRAPEGARPAPPPARPSPSPRRDLPAGAGPTDGRQPPNCSSRSCRTPISPPAATTVPCTWAQPVITGRPPYCSRGWPGTVRGCWGPTTTTVSPPAASAP